MYEMHGCWISASNFQSHVFSYWFNVPSKNRQKFSLGFGEHHKEITPLLKLNKINIVNAASIADGLHLIDYGVTRKNVQGYTFGQWGAPKWSEETCKIISKDLIGITQPSEFHRKFRTLEDVKFWKASECSAFLHYASIYVLKDRITSEAYDHFLLYFCAITMLSTDFYKSHWKVADDMLALYVKEYGRIYGEGYVSSNVHNLLHVYVEVND